jgi:AcrR family transcriptional regulator
MADPEAGVHRRPGSRGGRAATAPARREQIFRSAVRLVGERGFTHTTMRDLAEETGVSTGMVNHYFANKSQLLAETLRYVSENMQQRIEGAINAAPPGRERLVALVRSALPTDDVTRNNWRVWVQAFTEATRSEQMRALIQERYDPWYELVADVLGGALGIDRREATPLAWRFDALLNGMIVQSLTDNAQGPLDTGEIETALLEFADAHAALRRGDDTRR